MEKDRVTERARSRLRRIAVAGVAALLALSGCASGLYHVVGPGETLNRIAQAYDVPPSRIAEINRLPNPDRLYVGEYLFIPGARERRAVAPPSPSAAAALPASAPAAPPGTAAKPAPTANGPRTTDADPPAKSAVGSKVREEDLGEGTPPVAKAKVPASTPEKSKPAAPPPKPAAPAPAAPEPTIRGTHEPPIVEEIRPTVPAGKAGSFRPQWPTTGAVLSGFGDRSGAAHEGLDIGGPPGSPITAAADGTVMFAGTLKGYGKLVLIKHDAVYSTIYAHNRKNLVREGERVKRGQPIAEMGATGRADVVHLHFEVLESRKPVDPRRFLPRR